MLRTGLYKMPANAGKRDAVLAVFQEYRRTAVRIGQGQWRLFQQTGRFDKQAKLGVPTALSARYVQTCQYQVVSQLSGFLSNCAMAFKELVLHSSVDEQTRIALLYLNKYQNWYKRDVQIQGQPIAPEVLKLARSILRQIFRKHHQPNLARINMALDEKVAAVHSSGKSKTFSRWIKLSTLEKGKPVWLPLVDNTWFDALAGTPKAFCQINQAEDGELWAGLIKDVAPTPYQHKLDILGLDVGLKHLLASSEGDLLGNDVLPKLALWDRQIVALAANRQRLGLKMRSGRYDRLVQRMRAFLKNEIHRTLRAVILKHQPAHIAIERLDFRSPGLSRRMNRLVQNFGRRAFKDALDVYAEQYGFQWTEVEPAYSSQTCRKCGYVDKRNRKGEVFKCLHCGHHEQADIHASRNLAQRLREDLGCSGVKWSGRRRPLSVILDGIVRRFASAKRLALVQQGLQKEPLLLKQRKRRDSTPRLVMLGNPHFSAVLKPLIKAASVASATQPLAA